MRRAKRLAGALTVRLAFGYVIMALVFAAAWMWSLSSPLTQAALEQQQRNLTAVAQSAALVAAESTATPETVAKRLVARTDLRLTVVAVDGTVLADSNFDPATMENHLTRPEIQAALSGDIGSARRVSQTEGHEGLYVAVPASFDGERVALRVSQPIAEIEEISARSRRVGLLLLIGSLAVGAAVGMTAIGQARRPIVELSQTAEKMAAGNLTVCSPDVPTDLQGLADALDTLRDQMRARLAAVDAERATLRTTVDGLPDAVLLVDGGIIELANSSASRMFQPPVRGWEGECLRDTSLPVSLLAVIEECAGETGVIVRELDPDPTGRTLRVVIAPLHAESSSHRTVVTVADITDQARLERVRRDFVANASHELKTPTAGLRLLAQSVQAASDDGDTETALMFARQIDAETQRLQRLVRDLLDLSRLESTARPDKLTDIRTAVDNALLSHRSAAQRKDLDLILDLTTVRDIDLFAKADPTDIAIALDNLLDNAIAYTERGSVRVSVEADDDIVIAVSDTGPGIPPEHQGRVFERFYRIDRARSRDVGGTGLGLALVKHVVEVSGGSVRLISRPGTGSTFVLTLPRAR